MSTRLSSPPTAADGPALHAADVAAWLRLHPEFFAEHPALLSELRLPHPAGAHGTVSLIERQVALLRDKNRRLERRLEYLLAVVRDNETLNRRLWDISQRLAAASGLEALCTTLTHCLDEHFQVQHCALRLLAKPGTPLADSACGLCHGSAAAQAVEEFLAQSAPVCGQVSPSWLQAALGAAAANCRSALLLPVQAGGLRGVLAIGSPDPQRFRSHMATDYLQGLARLVGVLAARFVASHPPDGTGA